MAENSIVPNESVIRKIYLIRGQKVMLDFDLANLYQVETRRFPEDFMFQLESEEWNNLKSQIATSSWGGRRTNPFDLQSKTLLCYQVF